MTDFESRIVDFDEDDIGLAEADPTITSSILNLARSGALTAESHFVPAAAFKPSLARQRQEAQAHAQKQIDAFVKDNPDKFTFKEERIALRIEAKSFIKAQPGGAKVYKALIEHILTPSAAVKKQGSIRSYIEQQFPSHSVTKDWTKPLPPWAIQKIKDRIQGSAAPIGTIKLPKKCTLNQLHKAAAAAVERHKTGAQTFRPIVEVTEDSVIINGAPFPIGLNKGKKATYEYARLPLPKLMEALSAGK